MFSKEGFGGMPAWGSGWSVRLSPCMTVPRTAGLLMAGTHLPLPWRLALESGEPRSLREAREAPRPHTDPTQFRILAGCQRRRTDYRPALGALSKSTTTQRRQTTPKHFSIARKPRGGPSTYFPASLPVGRLTACLISTAITAATANSRIGTRRSALRARRWVSI